LDRPEGHEHWPTTRLTLDSGQVLRLPRCCARPVPGLRGPYAEPGLRGQQAEVCLHCANCLTVWATVRYDEAVP